MAINPMRSEFPHMNESNAKIFEEARTTLQEGLIAGKEELKAKSNQTQEINQGTQPSLPTS